MLIPSFCFAQLDGYIELGKDIKNPIYYTDIQLSYQFNFKQFFIKPYGGQLTWFENGENNLLGGSDPFMDTYYIGIEAGYKNITFGIDHFCSHAVYDHDNWQKYNNPPHNQQLTKIFARYKFR